MEEGTLKKIKSYRLRSAALPLIAAAVFGVVTGGCQHEATSVATSSQSALPPPPTKAESTKLLTSLQGMSASDRLAYVKAHPSETGRIMNGADSATRAQLMQLMAH